MSALIKLKRGLEQAIKQVVLEKGEPAFSLNTRKLFIGDEITPGGHEIGIQAGINLTKIYNDGDFDAITNVLHAVDTSSQQITAQLPKNPIIGDQVRFFDVEGTFGTNNLILDGNGEKVEGSYNNYPLNTTGGYILYYGTDGVNNGWYAITADSEGWFDSGVEDAWQVYYTNQNKTAVPYQLLLVDTQTSGIQITTPNDPKPGDKFQIQDYNNTWNSNPVTVVSSDLLNCGSGPLSFNEQGGVITFIYDVCSNGDLSWVSKVGRDQSSSGDATIDTKIQEAIDAAINSLVDGAPTALNTLNEIAAAIGDNASFASSVVFKADIKTGSNNFAGNESEVTIAHNLGSSPSYVNVTPTSNPGGYLGEVWVRKDATNIYVGNSGEHVGAFNWIAYK